jgi:DNA-binding CsgD family transcriptional regulator
MEQGKTQAAGVKAAAMPICPDHGHCDGYPCLSRGAAAFSHHTWQEIRGGLKLSPRELQIVQGIFDDKLEYSIATELGISVNTVRTELRRLRHKLNTADRVTLVLCVMEEFLRQTTSAKTTLPAICRDHSAGNCPLMLPKARAASRR